MIDDATGGQSSRAGTTEQQSEGVRVVVVVVVVVVYYVYYLISTFAHKGLRSMPKHASMDQLLTCVGRWPE